MNTNLLIEQANVNTRAQNLFANGYRARSLSGYQSQPAPIVVTNPQGEEYCVDLLTKTCTCAYFQKRNADLKDKPFGERTYCKHLIGARQLVAQTEADACEMDVDTYLRWKEENEAREAGYLF